MDRCRICFQYVENKITFYDYFCKPLCICGECRVHFTKLKKSICMEGLKVECLYEYNDFLENLLFRFKESRDVALKEIFLDGFINHIKYKYRGYTIVYMPSNDTKTKERGFIPLALIFERLKLKQEQVFIKQTEYKQSLQSFQQRKAIYKILQLDKSKKVPPTKLLLVDDVCTSGSTLLAAFRLLENHPYEVKALVVCIHKKLLAEFS